MTNLEKLRSVPKIRLKWCVKNQMYYAPIQYHCSITGKTISLNPLTGRGVLLKLGQEVRINENGEVI